jgi:hypothetical protein
MKACLEKAKACVEKMKAETDISEKEARAESKTGLEEMKATELEANQGKTGAGAEHCSPVPHAEVVHPRTTPQDRAADVLHGALKEVMSQETIRATED